MRLCVCMPEARVGGGSRLLSDYVCPLHKLHCLVNILKYRSSNTLPALEIFFDVMGCNFVFKFSEWLGRAWNVFEEWAVRRANILWWLASWLHLSNTQKRYKGFQVSVLKPIIHLPWFVRECWQNASSDKCRDLVFIKHIVIRVLFLAFHCSRQPVCILMRTQKLVTNDLREVHDTQKVCKTWHKYMSYFMLFMLLQRKISCVSHLEPSHGRSGNYAWDKGIISCDKRDKI